MNKCRSELSEKERELLRIRRASGTKASQLAQMEKMLQETKSMLEKKDEMGMKKEACGDTMGLYHSLFLICVLRRLLTNVPFISLMWETELYLVGGI